MRRYLGTLTLLTLCMTALSQETIQESERKIPLAYDADVVVVGGTTRGVAAAVSAAESGAKVFLAAPRPYLGEDLCATYQLWLEEGEVPRSELAKAIFSKQQAAATPTTNGTKFTYKADVQSNEKHRDDGRMLTDGKYSAANTQSVQYDKDVTIVADLGKPAEIKKAHVLVYQRPDEFVVKSVAVSTSSDRKEWSKPVVVPNKDTGRTTETKALGIACDLGQKARYVRFSITKADNAQRVLIGEIVIESDKVEEKGDDSAQTATQFRPPTPLHVKRVLDSALLKAKVNFLYGCYVTDLLRDAKGNPAGIVMTNRAGRQAVRAKVIIDATDRGTFARTAGAAFAPYPTGKQTFKRIVLGGEPGKNAKELGMTFSIASDARKGGSKGKTYKVYEYTLELPMKDSSWSSFAAADQQARDMTWQDGQAYASESLFQVPPDPLKSRKQQEGAWPGAAKVDLDALRPADVNGMYVLGGCADISREAAAQLMRPINGMDLGARVGQAAAKEAEGQQIGPVAELVVNGESNGENVGEIGEMLNGLRSMPGSVSQPYVKSPVRGIPVLGRYDVVIIGGGTGGAPAGIGAGRAGAKTLVVEYLHGLGGVGTLGRISKYYHGNKVGFTTEIDRGLSKSKKTSVTWNVEQKMEWYRKELVKTGAHIWFQSLGCGSVVKGNRFVGAIVVTPHGRGVVLANTVIDATGNAVIPACAGLPCQEIDDEHISVQGTGLPTFTPGEPYLNGDWTFNDDDDVVDMWRMFVVAKHKYKNAYDLGQLITTRARRRIIGDVMITPMDIINKRTYPDVITVAKSNFDNHGFSSHTIFMVTPPDRAGLVGNVPFRALMPKGYDGLLVTGLGLSAHGDAMPVLRMQPDIQNQGYAAGHAAALAAGGNTTVRKIDVKRLQKHLVGKGIIPESMLTAKDSYPISDEKLQDAVGQIGADYKGISMVLTNPEKALPMLQSAWRNVRDEKAKVRYAHVLGMLGDNTGTETLIKAVSAAEWDKGWNFRGMGQYGATTSPVDNLVIALGRTGDKRGLDAVLGMLGKLSNESDFSHCRAVAIALETYKDPRAAKPLADLLKQEGVSGHAFTDIRDTIKRTPPSASDNSTRQKSLRELVLARALYRCGDHECLGENILKQYAKDFRGLYARHAKAILKEGKSR